MILRRYFKTAKKQEMVGVITQHQEVAIFNARIIYRLINYRD